MSIETAQRSSSRHNSSVCARNLGEGLAARRVVLTNFQALLKWLNLVGYPACEVPADGNCGVWSLLALKRNDPWMRFSDPMDVSEAKVIRAEISGHWLSEQTSQVWMNLFQNVVSIFNGPEPGPDSDHADQVKTEPSSSSVVKSELLPTEKRCSGSALYIDLSSPSPKAKARKVETVGLQKSAFVQKSVPQEVTVSTARGQKKEFQEHCAKMLEEYEESEVKKSGKPAKVQKKRNKKKKKIRERTKRSHTSLQKWSLRKKSWNRRLYSHRENDRGRAKPKCRLWMKPSCRQSSHT